MQTAISPDLPVDPDLDAQDALQAAQTRFPALSRIQNADAAFDRENPDVVVVLPRRTGTASTSIPAFGQILLT